MRLVLAPMQGVVDMEMREILTSLGGFDRCVTEFVRVTDQKFPNKVFFRNCPELETNGRTAAGTPVFIQLLGGQPSWMAANAAQAVSLGAPGIDINFGCPAKIVNRNDGGSVLLKEPKRLGLIVAAVRDAVDPAILVTAKIRLGFNDTSLLEDIVASIIEAGASELCIHARTRADGYQPPAHWHHIKPLLARARIAVIANGEIWSPQDALEAQAQSGCTDLMLGRGALACPDLARQIKMQYQGEQVSSLPWHKVLEVVLQHFELRDQWSPRYVGNRTKQWLAFLRLQYTEAELLFQQIKRLTKASEINALIERHLDMGLCKLSVI